MPALPMGRRVLLTALILLGPSVGSMAGTSGASANAPVTCSLATGLKVRQNESQGAAGNIFLWIEYVNAGKAACELSGIPTARPVQGGRDTPVGPPSQRWRAAGLGGTVRLAPRGGTASDAYWVLVPGNFPKGCSEQSMSGVMLSLDRSRAFYVAFHPRVPPIEVCSNKHVTFIDGVARGLDSGGP